MGGGHQVQREGLLGEEGRGQYSGHSTAAAAAEAGGREGL